MIVVLVYVHVNEDAVDAFRVAAEENARNSINETGIARFDVIQQLDDPRRFILVEVYRSYEAQAAHKETAHYVHWRDTVAPMMAEPRVGVKHVNIYPEDSGW